jgi:ribA/ribD-fused uncharacterized protein
VQKINVGTNALLIERGKLLNFHFAPMILPHPITGEDCEYNTVEHRFQAMKGLFCADDQKEWHDWVNDPSPPAIVKNRGRQLDIDVDLWNLSSFYVMLEAQLGKFSQNKNLRQCLLDTGEDKIIEHRPDRIWGDNMDGTGQNLCGKSLMLVRSILAAS